VLLADVQSTSIEPLLRLLLVPRTGTTQRLWGQAGWSSLLLRDVL
jgi:membrane protein